MVRIALFLIINIVSYPIHSQTDTLKFGDGYVNILSTAENNIVCELQGNFNYEGYGPEGTIPLGSIIFRSLQQTRPELSDSVVIELYSKSQQDGIPDYESKNYFDFDSKSIISLEDINRSSSEKEGKYIGIESFYPKLTYVTIGCDALAMNQEEILKLLIKNKVISQDAYIHASAPLIIKFHDNKAKELLIASVKKEQNCHFEIYSIKNN